MSQLCLRSEHQQMVDEFMRRAGQAVPTSPTVPDEFDRVLRATLMLEELLEFCRDFGVEIQVPVDAEEEDGMVAVLADPAESEEEFKARYAKFHFMTIDSKTDQPYPVNLAGAMDACADLRVTTTGSMSACGVADTPVQRAVDEANLARFGPGGYRAANGKWIRPASWQPPDIAQLLRDMTAACCE